MQKLKFQNKLDIESEKAQHRLDNKIQKLKNDNELEVGKLKLEFENKLIDIRNELKRRDEKKPGELFRQIATVSYHLRKNMRNIITDWRITDEICKRIEM